VKHGGHQLLKRRDLRARSRRSQAALLRCGRPGTGIYVSLLGRTKTFKVWLVDRGNVERAHYHAAALPGIGETIFVRKTELDDEGRWQTMKIKPVPARVTRVRGGMITAVNIDGDHEDALASK
jgi:hypothetical protein